MTSQFGIVCMDYLRKFNMDVEIEGNKESKEFYRRYNFMIPMGTNFEETYEVLAEIMADVKKMEQDNKDAMAARAAKEAAESVVAEVI